MAIRYRNLTKYEDFLEVENIQRDAWGMPELAIVPKRLMYATVKSGGVAIGAYEKEELIGYCWGWIGKTRKQGTFIYSHHNAVRKNYQGQGIGTELKKKQREWAIFHNIRSIYWTFDPLVARNAYLNLHKLGGISRTYYVNHWGMMEDALNKGLETDRVYIEWHLLSAKVENALRGHFKDYTHYLEDNEIQGIEVKEGKLLKAEKINLNISSPVVLIRIPDDSERYPLPLRKEWRIKLRTVLQHYLHSGYTLSDFVIDKNYEPIKCYHVLTK